MHSSMTARKTPWRTNAHLCRLSGLDACANPDHPAQMSGMKDSGHSRGNKCIYYEMISNPAIGRG